MPRIKVANSIGGPARLRSRKEEVRVDEGHHPPEKMAQRRLVLPPPEEVEQMCLGGIAQAATPVARNPAGRYCRVMVEIEQDDEDGTRTVIKSSPWAMYGPKEAVRFIRRHTGYDPFA